MVATPSILNSLSFFRGLCLFLQSDASLYFTAAIEAGLLHQYHSFVGSSPQPNKLGGLVQWHAALQNPDGYDSWDWSAAFNPRVRMAPFVQLQP